MPISSVAVSKNATFPASIRRTVFAGVRATPYLSRPVIERFMTGGKRTNAFAILFLQLPQQSSSRVGTSSKKEENRWRAARALRASSVELACGLIAPVLSDLQQLRLFGWLSASR